MIDGASHVQIFFRIILPLVTPILARLRLLAFVGAHRRVPDGQSIFLRDDRRTRPSATGLYGLIDGDRSNNLGRLRAPARS